MKPNKNRSQFLSLAILVFLTTLAGFAQGTGANRWKMVGPGGGGTTIGPTISPHDSQAGG